MTTIEQKRQISSKNISSLTHKIPKIKRQPKYTTYLRYSNKHILSIRRYKQNNGPSKHLNITIIPNQELLYNRKELYSTEKMTEIEKKTGPLDRLRNLISKYGKCAIVVYFGGYIISFGTIYVLVASGLDIASLVNKIYPLDFTQKSQYGANIAVTYAINKMLTPLRIALAVYITPKIHPYWVNVFGK